MRTAALLVLAAALAGCVSTHSTQLGSAQMLSPVPAQSVTFYRSADQVTHPYSEVARLNSSGDWMLTNKKKMFASMRREAAKLGADGVILESVKEPNPAIKVAAAVLHVSVPRKGSALAILTSPAR